MVAEVEAYRERFAGLYWDVVMAFLPREVVACKAEEMAVLCRGAWLSAYEEGETIVALIASRLPSEHLIADIEQSKCVDEELFSDMEDVSHIECLINFRASYPGAVVL